MYYNFVDLSSYDFYLIFSAVVVEGIFCDSRHHRNPHYQRNTPKLKNIITEKPTIETSRRHERFIFSGFKVFLSFLKDIVF